MSVEANGITESASPAPAPAPETSDDSSYDKALGDIYDKLTSEGVEDDGEPSTRDEKGRFAKAEQSSEGASPPKEPEGEQDEEQPERSDRIALTAGLPANWRPDMADIWEKVPEADRERLGKWSQEIHAKMSDMGRQVAGLREIAPVVDHMVQAFPGRFDGPNATHTRRRSRSN